MTHRSGPLLLSNKNPANVDSTIDACSPEGAPKAGSKNLDFVNLVIVGL